MLRLLLGAALLPAALRAQALSPQALSPQSLAARHDSLIGGRAVLESHKSMRMIGTFSVPDAGIEAPLEILKLRPNKYLFRTSFGQLGEVLSGFDGMNAWAVQPGRGPIVLEQDLATQVKEQADFFGDLHDYSRFAKVELADDADFEGHRVHRVRMVRANGDTLMEYFDAETGLSAGSVTAVNSPLGRQQSTTLVGEYKDFGGLRVATRIEQRNPQFKLIISIVSVEFDLLDEAAVAPPESVRALIKP